MHAETTTDAAAEIEIEAEPIEGEEAAAESAKEAEAGELVVTIGEEAAEADPFVGQQAPSWVKDLRKRERQLAKENQKLREQVQSAVPASQQQLPKEPDLEDFDYDAAKFKAAHREWMQKSNEIEQRNKSAKEQETAAERAWQERLTNYGTSKAKLGVADFDEAEETVFSVLNKTQQGIILQGSDKAELLIYALGRNPAKLQSLASIQDPVRYAFAVAQLETQLKTTRRPTTQPEGRIEQRSSGKPTTSEAGLEKLRAEAAKTGDYSKVTAYKQQMRAAKK
jgi:hypothetical protein